jgi:CheY-like chemotaxis protein
VTVSSEGPGRGSEFTVRIPLAKPRPMPLLAAAPTVSDSERYRAPGTRVLVVDDNRDAADALSDALSAAGYEVKTAYDGPSALGIAEAFRPRVALLDLGFPVMDGYELARRLGATHSTEGLRLVALTGYGQPLHREQSRAAGFSEHLLKPVDVPTISDLLRRMDEDRA